MLYKNIFLKIFLTIAIFLLYNFIEPLQENTPFLDRYIFPFFWSILIIYLINKNYGILASTFYIIFILMIFAEKINFTYLSYSNILVYTMFLFSLIFFLIFLDQRLKKNRRVITIFSFTLLFIIYIIPLFTIIYVFNFDIKVNNTILFSIFQSNTQEAYEYILDYISPIYLAIFIFFTFIIGFLLYLQEKKEIILINKLHLLFLIYIFTINTLIYFSQLRLPYFLIHGFQTYNQELNMFKQVQEKRGNGTIKFTAEKLENNETYVIIIGESLNKKHMGIYGYFRNTTPELEKIKKADGLLLFNNVYSNHTHTIPVLSQALTESNQYNNKNYYTSISIIEILKKAKITNYWLTNQIIYSAWDNLVSVIGTSSDYLVALNRNIGKQIWSNKFDSTLINEVKKSLLKKDKHSKVIFVHLMGNHGNYASRYPHKTFSIYKKPLLAGQYGTEGSKNKFINTYDNSVVYNDFVVGSILTELKKEKGIAGFMYIADHADDVIASLGHNSETFTYEMTQIPMIVWLNNKYIKKYPKKYKYLKKHTQTLFSNDMLYDTLIGIFNIHTTKYNQKYDLSSKKYKLQPKNALTLHGEKHYTNKNNYIYWQKMNAKYLIDTNQSSRIFPHRINSIGKLKDIWNDGFRSFETDIIFGDKNIKIFQVGHDYKTMGSDLDTFLSYIDTSKIKKIWLNFKNLNATNYSDALERLEYLNNKYHIKNKIILESSNKNKFFKLFKFAGWHTSYYLTTNKIINLLKNKDITKLNILSKKIISQIKVQKLSAISFDQRLYTFVKKYLEPNIPNNLVYHIWHAPVLHDIDFKHKLLKSKLYLDSRIKTLLTPYKSQFNL